ncbi:MAG: hypothetical protein ACFB4J_02705 [Elainellaceae cyanobacterium]
MAYCIEGDRQLSAQPHPSDDSSMTAYFIALYTYQGEHLFGDVFNGAVQLNANGQIIHSHWLALPHQHPDLQLDTFIVAPDGVRGILFLEPATSPQCSSIAEILEDFKSHSSHRISGIYPRGDLPLWQRNACCLTIRNDTSLQILRYYMEVSTSLE